MNAILLNARHMVYRRLSPVGDDRRRGQGAPVAIWHDRSRLIAESDQGHRRCLAGPLLSALRPPLAVELVRAGRWRALLVPWRCWDE